MKQLNEEDKQLLLKDLSARLPYGVKIHVKGEYKRAHKIYSIGVENEFVSYFEAMHLYDVVIAKCVPYLRPMSSMTGEEKETYKNLFISKEVDGFDFDIPNYDAVDWLLEHHFDFRGLLEKGLALEAPADMYNTK